MAGEKDDLGRSSDVYVSFAFAAADVLLETDPDGNAAFAVGAAMALVGRGARALTGQPLRKIIHPSDQDMVAQALAQMVKGERVRNILTRVLLPDGKAVTVALSGYRHPGNPERLLVALSHPGGLPPLATKRAEGAAGVLDKDSFQAMAAQLLDAAPPDEPYQLTLVELPDVAAFHAEGGEATQAALASELGNRLKSLSVGGDAVGQLDDGKFGVLHSASVSPDKISESVTKAAQVVMPDAPPLEAKLATLVLDVADIPPEEAARALTYTLNAFAKDSANGGDLATLMKDLQPRLSATVKQMNDVRQTVASGDFNLMYQPIVDLWTNVVHHFECLVRFKGNDNKSPYETVAFAEDVGMAGMLDLALLERAIGTMRSNVANTESLKFAVNLSGRTLSDPAVVKKLRAILATTGDLRKRLVFEMTESADVGDLVAVNDVIQSIRKQGHEVCLDDFGAGHAAFHYLRALKVDNVKIDGSYIKDAMKNNENVSFIKAIVQLCTELGVSTTAEYVEDAETANLLKLLKVRYGQGWYFGKPAHPASDDIRTAWKTQTLEWRKGLLYFKG
ncbi:PAS domain S-box protein [Paramagnetospirillum kuznetsovii]|uniref:PAS domain S-box protein n=1 Tax=Paramagnetospirillum kuznetsovii TaxID=2053833 RepID=A0A364NTL9_9PROT|nr:EAL domain-containing protein [Paramagnetospirillum kuznetsovii]RAU20421.1 PAS domain S-box protein [Paramagnetospirillum kuznetsovii]